jgi:hypothetical protein
MDNTGQQITAPTLGSRLDHQAVDVVLRAHEEVRALRQDLVDSLPIRQLSDPIARMNHWPSYEDWYQLAKDVACLEVVTDRIVTQARVSRDEPWNLYKLAVAVRERWVSWRREEAHRSWQKKEEATEEELDDILVMFGVPELDASWSRVIDGFRWLTSHTKATL